MRLKITNIRDQGDLDKERIVMKVESAGNVGEFLLIQSAHLNNAVTNDVYHTYWFPDKSVNVGDFVVLYTKVGKNSEKPFKDVKSHFFYWGKTKTIWDRDDCAAVLMHAPEWESFKTE
ncbi:hypothetical protein F6R98_14175 [Candidatus Methylospira mobilis]|uniref:Uncharacterized protein n=1 Tax=Candidatus Methylospira mobilis TaxID=1808979 RepID=A0A5Q0BNE7_9GAMM|nr:hypothetical protein [Candidatus Methylospira mobilis]QFY43627.1 hypothetical protein F6R98_14175 [Candidatus Methylospira mobilis]WNV04615.1 hypothetical protein RP726_19820 [Candidatus Methylospira mobilis]